MKNRTDILEDLLYSGDTTVQELVRTGNFSELNRYLAQKTHEYEEEQKTFQNSIIEKKKNDLNAYLTEKGFDVTSENKKMELNEFIERLRYVHNNRTRIDREIAPMHIRIQDDSSFEEAINYLSKLYNEDEKVREYVDNGDFNGITSYIEEKSEELDSKYGVIECLGPDVSVSDHEKLAKRFDEIYKYHQAVSYDEHLRRKGLEKDKKRDDYTLDNYIYFYGYEEKLLNNFYDQIKNNDFSGITELNKTQGLLTETLCSLEAYVYYFTPRHEKARAK